MNFKLSIIIPHYNSIDSLAKLLSTIPDNKNIQVIIVDDHSTEEVKKEYHRLSLNYDHQRYLFLENSSPVHNAGAARNIGLQYVSGEWLLFADADDFFLEGFYDVVGKYFDEDYDLIYFKTTSMYIDTGETALRHLNNTRLIDDFLQNPSRQTENLLRTRFYVPYAKLIRSSVVFDNNIQFDEVPVSNDRMFSLKIGLCAKKISASNKIIYCVTVSKGSLTTKLDLESFETRANVDIRFDNYLREHLSHHDFACVGRFTAYLYIYKIIKRRYGWRVLRKYIKIFAASHMFAFNFKRFRKGMFESFFRGNKIEKKIINNYQADE